MRFTIQGGFSQIVDDVLVVQNVMRVEDVNNIVLTLMRIMVRVTYIFILEMFPKLDRYKYI